jgi:hypothetical protein
MTCSVPSANRDLSSLQPPASSLQPPAFRHHLGLWCGPRDRLPRAILSQAPNRSPPPLRNGLQPAQSCRTALLIGGEGPSAGRPTAYCL